jgi:hypothetical protein
MTSADYRRWIPPPAPGLPSAVAAVEAIIARLDSDGDFCGAAKVRRDPRWRRRGLLFVSAVTAATDRGKVSTQQAHRCCVFQTCPAGDGWAFLDVRRQCHLVSERGRLHLAGPLGRLLHELNLTPPLTRCGLSFQRRSPGRTIRTSLAPRRRRGFLRGQANGYGCKAAGSKRAE